MARGLILLLALCYVSCVAMGTKVEEAQLRQLERGKTSYPEVVNRLGPPTLMTLNADGSRVVTYSYSQSQAKVQNYIPIVAAFTQGATTETTAVTLTFDARETLVDYTATTGQTMIGTGFVSGGKQ